jgi:hypothetical protein
MVMVWNRLREWKKTIEARKNAKDADFGMDPFDFVPPGISIDDFQFD